MLPSEQAPNRAWPPPAAPVTLAKPQGKGWGRLVLAGAGAFLVASGLLLRFYAAPRLIAAPADLYQTDTLQAADASYFDQGSLTTRHGVTLTYTLTIRGDPRASTGTTAVWDSFAALADRKRGVQVNSTYQRAVFNRRTGQLLDCCGAAVNDDTRVRQHGVGLFWPIGVPGELQRYGARPGHHDLPVHPAHTVHPGRPAGGGALVAAGPAREGRQRRRRPLLPSRQHLLGRPADRRRHRHRAAGPVGAPRPRWPGQAGSGRHGPEDVGLKSPPAGRPGQQERCLDRHAAGARPPRRWHPRPHLDPGGRDPVPSSLADGRQLRGLTAVSPASRR